MSESAEICLGPGDDGIGNCGRPVFRGEHCQGHTKQMQRVGKLSPIQNLSARERLFEAVARWADAGSDADYNSAARAVERSALTLGLDLYAARIRKGMAKAKAEGRRVSRPPKLTPEEAMQLVERAGGIKRAAKMVGVGKNAIRRALRKGPKGNLMDPPPGSPRSA